MKDTLRFTKIVKWLEARYTYNLNGMTFFYENCTGRYMSLEYRFYLRYQCS